MVAANLLNTKYELLIANEIEVNIPSRLKNNILIGGSSLGGAVFVSYWSFMPNSERKGYKENSKHRFRFMISLTDSFNRLREDGQCTLDCECYYTPSLRSNKKPIEVVKVANKIIKYIKENEKTLVSYIE